MAPPVPERQFLRSPKLPKSTHHLDNVGPKKSLEVLNHRLVSYVEKVRKLQGAADVIDSIPRPETSDELMERVRVQYKGEMDTWRAKYEEGQSLLAQLKIELGNLKDEKRQLNLKVEDKVGALRDRDQIIATLEAEIAEVISKLNLLQTEKGRLIQNEGVFKSDIKDLTAEMEVMRKGLDRERIRSSELEIKLAALNQDMTFQIQLKNTELEEERKRTHVDVSALELRIRSDYEKRLMQELASLRRMYEVETDKAKEKYMYIHSSKVTELQELLSRERSNNASLEGERKGTLEKIGQLKREMSRLESERMVVEKKVKDLQAKLEEQGQSFQAQMVSKDGEIKLLLKEKKEDKAMYEKLESERDLLDMEIKTYQRILEDEEKRVQASIKLSKVSGGKGGVSSYSSESESEEELPAYRSVDTPDSRKARGAYTSSYTTTTYRSSRK